jgi:hypothetical protein
MTMDNAITLVLLCIFGPVAALIVVTLFMDDWISDRKSKQTIRNLEKYLEQAEAARRASGDE